MHEQIKVVVASGASTSSSALFSRAYPLYGVQIGSMSTGAVVGVFSSTDASVTYFPLFQPPNPQTATVTNVLVQIGSAVGASGGFIVIQGGFKDIQLRTTAVVSGGVSFNIIGLDG